MVATVVVLSSCHGSSPGPARPSPSAPRAGQEPRVIASDLFLCPGGFAFAAYGRLFYLPNDPDRPDASVRPTRCFASSAEARGAGFHLAPGPPGGQLIDDISLEPTTPSAEPTCRRAARTLGITILCPTLVPVSFGAITECERPDCVTLGAFVLQDSFAGPPGYVGIPGQTGNHLFLLESRRGRERSVGFLTCTQRKVVGTAAVRGRRAQWIDCPGGSSMNSGHVMLVWTEGDARYAISLHSDTWVNRAIALGVAQHLVAVSG
jgi:hypothetical protein